MWCLRVCTGILTSSLGMSSTLIPCIGWGVRVCPPWQTKSACIDRVSAPCRPPRLGNLAPTAGAPGRPKEQQASQRSKFGLVTSVILPFSLVGTSTGSLWLIKSIVSPSQTSLFKALTFRWVFNKMMHLPLGEENCGKYASTPQTVGYFGEGPALQVPHVILCCIGHLLIKSISNFKQPERMPPVHAA